MADKAFWDLATVLTLNNVNIPFRMRKLMQAKRPWLEALLSAPPAPSESSDNTDETNDTNDKMKALTTSPLGKTTFMIRATKEQELKKTDSSD
jgi:hypothetical protein